ncbi:hypothetical protein ATY89_03875 [Sulfolobus acidocaldarius]|uniref:Uncharacterized protein n=4 Tax=Sulfolobus acidocaldarius TaxID=2285 RepID=A0A0U2NF98_9CREN|nr:hypothetical membrane protein [Sulfolobus acidocaldarius DSM 639]AGE70460.1 hypothetical protein SacN8_02400 [Sulfolobus acidocaldarius N8]AGE72734.1 hypothetical protein SacRon12I_02395 [Sulfolobus acidocaldarius Ron12/I]ALU29160.1 hypothetical protein ATY89_03875 [Sulfolobus acidocaldarius]ALU31885.1 hypothetical protein ATZ20_06900 [Sulfolobus acidocaldarius]
MFDKAPMDLYKHKIIFVTIYSLLESIVACILLGQQFLHFVTSVLNPIAISVETYANIVVFYALIIGGLFILFWPINFIFLEIGFKIADWIQDRYPWFF